MLTGRQASGPVRMAALRPVTLAAQHPDAFIAELYETETDPEAVLAAVCGHRAARCCPPRSAGDYLAALERLGLRRTVSLLQRHETAI